MKKFLKWAGIGIGVLIALGILEEGKPDRIAGIVIASVGYTAYLILAKLEKIDATMAELRESVEAQLHQIKGSTRYCEEVIAELRERAG